MTTNVIASNNVQYQNNTQINSPTPTTWYKTQVIQVTSAITGTVRINYNFGYNCTCYDDTVGCIDTQVRKNGTTIYDFWQGNCVSYTTFDTSISLTPTDTLELWVRNTDGNFSTYTLNFHLCYDIVLPPSTFNALFISGD